MQHNSDTLAYSFMAAPPQWSGYRNYYAELKRIADAVIEAKPAVHNKIQTHNTRTIQMSQNNCA